jgi:hypothetical protein
MDRGTVRPRISFPKIKFGKLVHLVGFIIRKFVTMHGHMNIKKCNYWVCTLTYKYVTITSFLLTALHQIPSHSLLKTKKVKFFFNGKSYFLVKSIYFCLKIIVCLLTAPADAPEINFLSLGRIGQVGTSDRYWVARIDY